MAAQPANVQHDHVAARTKLITRALRDLSISSICITCIWQTGSLGRFSTLPAEREEYGLGWRYLKWFAFLFAMSCWWLAVGGLYVWHDSSSSGHIASFGSNDLHLNWNATASNLRERPRIYVANSGMCIRRLAILVWFAVDWFSSRPRADSKSLEMMERLFERVARVQQGVKMRYQRSVVQVVAMRHEHKRFDVLASREERKERKRVLFGLSFFKQV
jgi:hypothetical protein